MEVREGSVALVTGGASGIGLEIARSLAQAGASVALCDINLTALKAASEKLSEEGMKVVGVELNVSDEDNWQRAAAAVERSLGPISILCNNAGVGPGKAEVDVLAFNDWRWTMGVNLDGVFLGTRTIVPRIVAAGQEGHIVNTASILGLFPKPHHAAYVASKFAVVGLSEVMRMELAPKAIGVSVLCPGLVRTGLRSNSQKLRPSGDGSLLAEARPTGLQPEIIGPMVVDAIRANRFYILPHHEY